MSESKVDIQMTPMLDMIFQLLVFFILTFRPVIDEGQFDITLSSAAGGSTASPSIAAALDTRSDLPISIILKAGKGGMLAHNGIVVGERTLGSMAELEKHLKSFVDGPAEELEVTIVADEGLQYQYAVQAINAVTHVGIRQLKLAKSPQSQ